MKKIILFLICFTGLFPVMEKGEWKTIGVLDSYANGYGEEVALCAGYDFVDGLLCQVEFDCNTLDIIDIIYCDDGEGDEGGGDGDGTGDGDGGDEEEEPGGTGGDDDNGGDNSSGGGGGSSSVDIGTDVPSDFTSHPVYTALSNLVGSLDLSANFASAAAHFAGTTLPRGFVYSGVGLSAVSTMDNYIQMIEGFNINDAVQAGIGTTLIGIGLAASAGIITSPVAVPAVLIGGVGLFIWEQAESYYGW